MPLSWPGPRGKAGLPQPQGSGCGKIPETPAFLLFDRAGAWNVFGDWCIIFQMFNKETRALLRKMPKPLGWLLCAYLALFFAVILPFHHHANEKAAADCQICAVAGRAASANAGPGAVIISLLFLLVASCSAPVISSRSKTPHLRGPPIF